MYLLFACENVDNISEYNTDYLNIYLQIFKSEMIVNKDYLVNLTL